jgi:two-component system LytT family sensor kinase
MNRQYTRITVLGLLYLVFLIYRLAFWDDFRYLELLQIVLNSFFDLCVTCLLAFLLYRLGGMKIFNWSKGLQAVAKMPFFILSFYVCIRLLQKLHLFGYDLTTGVTEKFMKVFNLVSYQVFNSYIVLAFGVTLLLAFFFYEKFSLEKLEKEHAEKEKTMSELRFLKAQINPHFIFNTLNNIHFLIDIDNRNARQMIHEFSELLRFQLYEMGNERVNLRDELQYIRNYIHIQQIRKEDGFTVKLDSDENLNGSIAPMLLVILLENAFKYTGSSEKDYIFINLSVDTGNFLTFRIVNSIDRRIVPPDSRGGGLGLSNLRKRLDLIYGQDARLDTERTESEFRAVLKIKL